jgi:molecular chaperone GrpE
MSKSPFEKKKKRKKMTTKSGFKKEESSLDECKEGSQEEKLVEAVESVVEETVTVGDLQQESMQRQADDWKEKYMLLLAESENARKRLQKEKQQMIGYATSNVIVDLLPPLDQMEKALGFAEQMSEDVKSWALGFKMILGQFKTALEGHGVDPFDAKGAFDPHLHEAIETVETTEFHPGTIIEQCMRGYRMGERVIQPAKVKVAKAPEEAVAIDLEIDSQDEKILENESK